MTQKRNIPHVPDQPEFVLQLIAVSFIIGVNIVGLHLSIWIDYWKDHSLYVWLNRFKKLQQHNVNYQLDQRSYLSSRRQLGGRATSYRMEQVVKAAKTRKTWTRQIDDVPSRCRKAFQVTVLNDWWIFISLAQSQSALKESWTITLLVLIGLLAQP